MRSSWQSRSSRLRRGHRLSVVGVVVILAAAALTLAACGGSTKSVSAFTADELTALPQEDWITNGGTVFNQRYSPLDQVNRSNVADLKGVWRSHLNSATAFKYSGETQPLVHDGIAYLSTGASDVFALDVETGKTIWKYEGQPRPEHQHRLLRLDEPWCRDRRRSAFISASSTGISSRSTRIRAKRSGPRPSGTGEREPRSRVPPSTTTAWSSPGSPAASSECGGVSRPTTRRPASSSGASTRSPALVRSATTPGRRTTTRGSTAALLSGRRLPSIPSSGSSISQPATRHPTSTAAPARATTCSRTRSSPSTRRRASTGGISSRSATTSGTSTLPRRWCSST